MEKTDSLEAIKHKILDTAQQRANAIVDAAQKECDAAMQEANADIKSQRESNLGRANERKNEIKSRNEMLSRLEVKKIELRAKQDLVDGVYKSALLNAKKMPINEYAALMESILTKYAQNGDEVVFAAAERLDEAWLNDFCAKSKLKLSLAKDKHNESGGFILRSGKFDKRVTLEALMSLVRERTEGEVIGILF